MSTATHPWLAVGVVIHMQDGAHDVRLALVHVHVQSRLVPIYPQPVRVVPDELHATLSPVVVDPCLGDRAELQHRPPLEVSDWMEEGGGRAVDAARPGLLPDEFVASEAAVQRRRELVNERLKIIADR